MQQGSSNYFQPLFNTSITAPPPPQIIYVYYGYNTCHWQVFPWATNAYNIALKIINWAHLVEKKYQKQNTKLTNEP
jgi:hypothetical protein